MLNNKKKCVIHKIIAFQIEAQSVMNKPFSDT